MDSAVLTLSTDEIHALTGYRRAAEQLAELHRLGYWRARRSRSGEVIVERAHFEAVARGDDKPRPRVRPRLRMA